jgi:hypothetical protein
MLALAEGRLVEVVDIVIAQRATSPAPCSVPDYDLVDVARARVGNIKSYTTYGNRAVWRRNL